MTASDLSQTAIHQVQQQAEAKGLAIIARQDDILNSQLQGPFDWILDRGCFHVLPPDHSPSLRYAPLHPRFTIAGTLLRT